MGVVGRMSILSFFLRSNMYRRRKINKMLMLFGLPLYWMVIVQAQASEHVSAQVAALAYDRPQGYSSAECKDIALRFDLVIGLNDYACRRKAKKINPKLIVLQYTNSSNCTAGDPLCSYLEKQDNPAQFFLKFTSNGVQDIDGKRYKRHKGSRICAYGDNGWCEDGGQGKRWTTDYVSPSSRQKIVSFFSDLSNLQPAYDGYFFDNMDRGCSYPGLVAEGKVDHDAQLDNNGDLGANTLLERSCNKLRTEISKALPKNIYAIDNISNYGLDQCHANWWRICVSKPGYSQPYPEAVALSRGVLQEFYYRFSKTLPDIKTNYNGLKEIWRTAGSPSNHIYVAWWMRTGDADVESNSDRVKLYALATHLLFQFPAMYMRYDGADANNQPLEGDWFGALGVDLGLPKADAYVMDDGRTMRRDFEKGIVMVRFRLKDQENYTDQAVYRLAAPIQPIDATGRKSQVQTAITLHNAQAFIGLYPSVAD